PDLRPQSRHQKLHQLRAMDPRLRLPRGLQGRLPRARTLRPPPRPLGSHLLPRPPRARTPAAGPPRPRRPPAPDPRNPRPPLRPPPPPPPPHPPRPTPSSATRF